MSAAYLIALELAPVVPHRERVRPLYDGAIPPAAYHFVDPPRFFAPGNVEPTGASVTIRLGRSGSDPASVATGDGQLVISLGRGAIAPRSGETRIAVRITPLAPQDLPPLPRGLRPNGNAYRVDATYQPGGARVTGFASPGALLMEIPEIGHDLFASARGLTWTPIPSQSLPPRDLTITATVAAPGYYLAATNLPELALQPSHGSPVPVGLGLAITALAVAALFGSSLLLRRRRGSPRRQV